MVSRGGPQNIGVIDFANDHRENTEIDWHSVASITKGWLNTYGIMIMMEQQCSSIHFVFDALPGSGQG